MARIQNAAQIHAALRAYLVSRTEHEQILKDNRLQLLFSQGWDTEAQRIIAEQYPYGTWKQVHDYALALLYEMYRMIPHTMDLEEIWRRPDLFKKALALAAQC